MKKKNNFNQAMYEMFGVGSEGEPEMPENMEEELEELMDAETAMAASVVPAATPQASMPNVHTSAPVSAAPYVLVPSTYLAPGTEMEGTLKSKGDVEIAGKFVGKIESEGDVTLHTFLDGTVDAVNLTILDCELQGDCHVSGRLQINSTSRVTGNIFAGDLLCSGAIVGDSEIKGNATFDSTADVQGNITTGTMTMERGAMIAGSLIMKGKNRRQ